MLGTWGSRAPPRAHARHRGRGAEARRVARTPSMVAARARSGSGTDDVGHRGRRGDRRGRRRRRGPRTCPGGGPALPARRRAGRDPDPRAPARRQDPPLDRFVFAGTPAEVVRPRTEPGVRGGRVAAIEFGTPTGTDDGTRRRVARRAGSAALFAETGIALGSPEMSSRFRDGGGFEEAAGLLPRRARQGDVDRRQRDRRNRPRRCSAPPRRRVRQTREAISRALAGSGRARSSARGRPPHPHLLATGLRVGGSSAGTPRRRSRASTLQTRLSTSPGSSRRESSSSSSSTRCWPGRRE